MLIPLGFLASAGGGVETDYELIETQILGSNQASITFTGLGTYSSTYKHLQIRATMRSASTFGGGFADTVNVQLNGDGGTNYSSHYLWGTGSAVQSVGIANLTYFFIPDPMPANGGAANNFGTFVIDILDAYSTTKNKTLRSLGGYSDPNGRSVSLSSGGWRNTASITSVLLKSQSANTVAGSRFSIYGIKG